MNMRIVVYPLMGDQQASAGTSYRTDLPSFTKGGPPPRTLQPWRHLTDRRSKVAASRSLISCVIGGFLLGAGLGPRVDLFEAVIQQTRGDWLIRAELFFE